MNRGSTLPLLVVVAVVALVLGSIGTSVAGPAMTKAKVKKIAAKVVTKRAPDLAVASAANAANLNGLPPAAYQNQVYSFALPPSALDDSSRTFSLPGVPAGNYLATYTVFAQSTAPISMDCFIRTAPDATTREAFVFTNVYNSAFNTLSASAPVTITSATAQLLCEGSGVWGITDGGSGIVSRVTLVRVDSGTSLTTTVSRPAAESGRGPASVR